MNGGKFRFAANQGQNPILRKPQAAIKLTIDQSNFKLEFQIKLNIVIDISKFENNRGL